MITTLKIHLLRRLQEIRIEISKYRLIKTIIRNNLKLRRKVFYGK